MELHLMGDRNFSFDTYCGQVKIDTTDEQLTPFAGLVPFVAFLKKTGMVEALAASCPVVRTSPNALDVRDIILSYMLTVLCDGKHFNDVNYLRHDKVIPELLNIKRIVGDDTIRRFFKSMDLDAATAWIDNISKEIVHALPRDYILDFDSTVITRYGKQELAEVGYNPTKRGRKSHHPLVAIVADTRLCFHYSLRSGKSASSSNMVKFLDEIMELSGNSKPALHRADSAFSTDDIMSWHEADIMRPKYLFKLKQTNNIKQAIYSIDDKDWKGFTTPNALQIAEKTITLPSWSMPRRVVFTRRFVGKESKGFLWEVCEYKYCAYVCNIEENRCDAWQIVELYNQRGDCENVFDEIKNQWGFSGFCAKSKTVTSIAAKLLLLVYNLWTIFIRSMNKKKHTEAKTSRREYLLIAGKYIHTGRETIMKIATTKIQLKKIKAGFLSSKTAFCQLLRS